MGGILKAENRNLREQNDYLVKKLKLYMENEEHFQERCNLYSSIVSELEGHNLELSNQIEMLKRATHVEIAKME